MITSKLASRPDEDICMLLTFDNHKGVYACDCGTASRLTPKECGDTKALFISHTHIDHFINFDTFIRHQINCEFHVILCGPVGLAKSVRSKLQAYNWNLIQGECEKMTYEVREFIDNGSYRQTLIHAPEWELEESVAVNDKHIYENEKFSVDAVALDHKIPSMAYRFKEHDTVSIDIASSPYRGGKWIKELKEAYLADDSEREITVEETAIKAESLFHLLEIKKGNSLGFIMDHAGSEENHQKIKEHFYEVDELYIEAFYQNEDEETAHGNAHSTTGLSGKAAGLAQAHKAIPLHFSRKYDDNTRKEMELEFFSSFKTTLSK